MFLSEDVRARSKPHGPSMPRHRRRQHMATFLSQTKGAAIVEFAIILPIMLLIYMHLVDFSRSFNERRRVVRLSSTISDLIAQQSTTTALTSDMPASVFSVAASVMTPYPSKNVTMTVSVIQLTARQDKTCCDAKVRWTSTRGGTLRPCGVLLQQVGHRVPPRPDNIVTGMIDSFSLGNSTSAQLVVADVDDRYQPMFGVLNGLFVGGFQKTTYAFPRGNGDLVLQPSLDATQQKVCF